MYNLTMCRVNFAKYRRKILLDEIRDKSNLLRILKLELDGLEKALYDKMTYLKKMAVRYSIQKLNETYSGSAKIR